VDTTGPRLLQTPTGWLAMAKGWAVSGATREDALRRFEEAQQRHDEIDARPEPPRIARA